MNKTKTTPIPFAAAVDAVTDATTTAAAAATQAIAIVMPAAR